MSKQQSLRPQTKKEEVQKVHLCGGASTSKELKLGRVREFRYVRNSFVIKWQAFLTRRVPRQSLAVSSARYGPMCLDSHGAR